MDINSFRDEGLGDVEKEVKSNELGELPKNVRLFVWFRVLFNARFYYPVYTILFLDFGLSTFEFMVLNTVWAASIVLLEVPLGALADQIGKRTLVVFAAVLMVVEMLIFAFCPAGMGAVTFWVLLVNRVLSGAAEAAASGADEALAYDSLPEAEKESRWPAVMGRLFRWQAVSFIVALNLGALLYDSDVMSRVSGFDVAAGTSMRFPLLANVVTALVVLGITLRMREVEIEGAKDRAAGLISGLRSGVLDTIEAGKWVLKTPAPFVLIAFGLAIDAGVRMYYTTASNYWRLIEIPEAWFGVVGSLAPVFGFCATWGMEWMLRKWTPLANGAAIGLSAVVGLFFVSLAVPFWGAVMVLPLVFAMRMLYFALSQYLNAVTKPARRATVLSFKGLAFNMSYGAVTLLAGLQARGIRAQMEEGGKVPSDEGDFKLAVYDQAIDAWPWVMLGALGVVVAVCWKRWRALPENAFEKAGDGGE